VIHWKISDRLVVDIRAIKDCEILVVTLERRGKLVELTVTRAVEYMDQR